MDHHDTSRTALQVAQEFFAANAELDRFDVEKMMVDSEDIVVLGRFALHFPSGGRLDDPFAIHLVVRDGLIRS